MDKKKDYTEAHPVGNRVIILPRKQDDYIGGIIIPEAAKKAPTVGTASFVGPDCRQIKQGDTIMFPKMYGTEFEMNGVSYLVLKEDQVHSILK